jgi:EmrB/QacA subfamily drug resistance transporter
MTDISRASEDTPSVPVFLVGVPEPRRRRLVLTAAILASAMGFIDGSVVAIAMPAMRDGLGASLAGAQWIGAGYLLALSSLVLTGGAMGDRFGVARVFSLGILIFVAASVICTLAPTTATMIAARIVQGAGAGLMVPGSMAIVSRSFPPEDRGRALGLWAGAASAATVAGPIIGGVLLTWGPDWAWRLIFALNLPAGVVALWLLWRGALPDSGRPGTPVDLTGAALASASLALIAWGLTELLWSATLGGVAVFAAFLMYEARASAPMVRLGLFRDPNFAAVNAATLFLFFALPAVLFYLPMTAMTAWGATGIEVTGALLPLGLLIGALSPPAGRLADRTGPGPLIATGALCVAAAFAGLAWVARDADIWRHVLPLMALTGFGMGLVAAPLSVGVMAAAGEAEQGAASGINNAVARVANLVAVAMMGGVAAAAYARAGGTASFAAAADLSPQHLAATASGFAVVAWIAAAAAMIASVIAALWVRRRG